MRNPFGVADVPDPMGDDVAAFADSVAPHSADSDPNAVRWADATSVDHSSIDGRWSSRWNADSSEWRVGHGAVRADPDEGRVFILFDWDDGANQGLIEARYEGEHRLVGRYLNLGTPDITRPWVGFIIDWTRIDGVHPRGRLDFRR